VAANRKLSPAYLFPLLNEIVFVLLGVLLVFIALSRRFSAPRHSIAWMALGVILLYWGLRIWIRAMRTQPRWPSRVRAASLALVGAIVLGIAFLPFSFAAPLLAVAGGILALRGVVSVVILARTP
jgi:predicted membrane channel-forming protein YqfA (hemolysin III family)